MYEKPFSPFCFKLPHSTIKLMLRECFFKTYRKIVNRSKIANVMDIEITSAFVNIEVLYLKTIFTHRSVTDKRN